MDVNFPDARDRLDQPIFNAIEAKNLKQALKLVDKRLAKKPDEFLQVCAFEVFVFFLFSFFHSPSSCSYYLNNGLQCSAGQTSFGSMH